MSENVEETFPATVAKVIDNYTVVINRGSEDGIRDGMKFLIYGESEEEIIDPVSNKSLGILEIVKGMGEVILVQQKMATIKSSEKTSPKKEIIKPNPSVLGYYSIMQDREVIIPGKRKPFENPKTKDKAKPI